MHLSRLLLVALLLGGIATRAQSGWTPLWNGTDLDGWTTWMRPAGARVGGAGAEAERRREIHGADRVGP